MSNTQQVACTYAALLLADSGKIDADTILAVTKAAKVDVSKGMATAFAGVAKTADFTKILSTVSFGAPAGAAAPAAAAAAPAAGKAAAAAKPESSDDDDDMGGLF
jgi:ribosomal protein L12E/L44/L45/RPP1/RPP2